MSGISIEMEEATPSIPEEALVDVPLFPLPGAVLIPRTLISLHIFEPRYRVMIEDCIEGTRVLAVATIDDNGQPDQFQRPPLFPVAGLGVLRRAAKLPDGRFNIVVEGVERGDITQEHAPTDKPYRRATARVLESIPSDDDDAVIAAVANLRSIYSRAVALFNEANAEIISQLNEVKEPGRLADLITAAAIEDPTERQRILATQDELKRVGLVSAALGEMLLTADDGGEGPSAIRWGIRPAKA